MRDYRGGFIGSIRRIVILSITYFVMVRGLIRHHLM